MNSRSGLLSYSCQNLEEKCLLKFAEQFNYVFLGSTMNEDGEENEDTGMKTYEVKSEDGTIFKYEIFFIYEPIKSRKSL